MDDKIKEILEKPEVPDFLLPENIPALIKENGRKRKIQVAKTLRTIGAAAACLMIVTVGLKVFTDNRKIEDCTVPSENFNAVQKNEDCMYKDADAAGYDKTECDMADSGTDLLNPQSFDIFSNFLNEEIPNEKNKSDDKLIKSENDIAASDDREPENALSENISVNWDVKDGKVILNSEKGKFNFTLEGLFPGFLENDIKIKDYLILEKNIYIIADLMKDSEKYTGVQKIDIGSSETPENDIFYIQSGEYRKAFLSQSNRLIIVSDKNVSSGNTGDNIPVYGNGMDKLVSADRNLVYYSSALESRKYHSLDILSISSVETDSSHIVTDYIAYVCPSPVLKFNSDSDNESVEVRSGLIQDVVLYDIKTGSLKINQER